ncbi:MAG: hypothetical protein JSU73_08510 [candidate division WOR-3 bacterium]|nr:MAG: hypothetical protein JSU73_08510 [candidate division WOR-3 bacterium]
MATRINHFIHRSRVSPPVKPVLGTSFNAADVHVHDLSASQPRILAASSFWYGILGGLVVKVTNAALSTKITIRICADAQGDTVIIPDTEADLVAGITTATTKTATYRIDLPVEQPVAKGDANFYVFAKVDAGTPNFDSSIITWME